MFPAFAAARLCCVSPVKCNRDSSVGRYLPVWIRLPTCDLTRTDGLSHTHSQTCTHTHTFGDVSLQAALLELSPPVRLESLWRQLLLVSSSSLSPFPFLEFCPVVSLSDSLHLPPVDRQPICSNAALHCVVADAAGQTAVEPLYTEVYVSNRGVQQHVCQLV